MRKQQEGPEIVQRNLNIQYLCDKKRDHSLVVFDTISFSDEEGKDISLDLHSIVSLIIQSLSVIIIKSNLTEGEREYISLKLASIFESLRDETDSYKAFRERAENYLGTVFSETLFEKGIRYELDS